VSGEYCTCGGGPHFSGLRGSTALRHALLSEECRSGSDCTGLVHASNSGPVVTPEVLPLAIAAPEPVAHLVRTHRFRGIDPDPMDRHLSLAALPGGAGGRGPAEAGRDALAEQGTVQLGRRTLRR
jgi:hypothetical protein